MDYHLRRPFPPRGRPRPVGLKLHDAVANDDEDAVREILQTASRTAMNFKAEFGYTPLWVAVCRGNTDIARVLLEQDEVDVNPKDDFYDTPLVWAAAVGSERVLGLLLEQDDIDLNHKNLDGNTALSLAAMNGHPEIVELLLKKDNIDLGLAVNTRTPLAWALKRGFPEIAQQLANADMSRNREASDGRTPLSWATENDKKDVSWVFLEVAAMNPNERDEKGRTPLSRAAEKGNASTVFFLLDGGYADANRKDNDGETPLSRAAQNKHKSVVQHLSGWDSTTLQSLIQDEKLDLVEFILQCTYNVNVPDDQGVTALHAAIASDRLDIAEQLISSGADVSAQDKYGITPLRLAVQRRRDNFFKLLFEKSASMRGITTDEWMLVLPQDDTRLVLSLSDGAGKKHSVDLLTAASERSPDEPKVEKRLFLFEEKSHWPACMTSCLTKVSVLGLSKSEITWTRNRSGPDATISVTALVPGEEIFTGDQGAESDSHWKGCGIAWTMTTTPERKTSHWKMVDHFSILPNAWIPDDDIDFLHQFIAHLTKRWLELCERIEKILSERRKTQLRKEGQSTVIVSRLANDARNLAELRSCLQGQADSARKFTEQYCLFFDVGDGRKALEGINDLSRIDDKIKYLDQVVRDLLQLEFAWVSINEAHRSTSLARSMKRLSWITFIFLPAMFASSLFGMNVNILKANPDWRWYLLFGISSLFLTIGGWLVFKYLKLEKWIEDNVGQRIEIQVRKWMPAWENTEAGRVDVDSGRTERIEGAGTSSASQDE